MFYYLIRKYEGYKCNAYKCPAGILTIGYGTTVYSNGEKVKKEDKITIEDAEHELLIYCNKNCLPVIKNLQDLRKKNFSNNQKVALYSLIYNIGQTKFIKSKCFNYLSLNKDNDALKYWNWIVVNGKKNNGLINRRNEEIELFFNVKNYIKKI